MAFKSLKTKKGAWIRPGSTSGRSSFPGSYGNYVYLRAAPKDYPKTAHQRKIGKCAIDHVTKGMTGTAIHEAIRACAGK